MTKDEYIVELQKAAIAVCEEAPESVEYGDWPELQEKVDKLSALASLVKVGVTMKITQEELRALGESKILWGTRRAKAYHDDDIEEQKFSDSMLNALQGVIDKSEVKLDV